jgi:hypothetical protein
MNRLVALLPLVLACSDDTSMPDSGGNDASPTDASSDVRTDVVIDQQTGDASDAAVAICSQTLTWNTSQLLSISTGSDYFGSVTPDELSIAWMTTAGTVLYADRTVTSSPFNTPQTLTADVALDRVSITSDGLTLIVVRGDRGSLAQTTRMSRTAAFSATLDTTQYANLDTPVTEIDGGNTPPHGKFADPMLSPDGQFLYYSQYGVTTYTLTESYRMTGDTTPWSQGRDLLETQFSAPDLSGTRRRPTGMSADDLTLFYYDMTTSTEIAAFRSDPLVNNTYTTFVSLGAAYENAMPTTSCTRIYFCSTSGSATNLYYADKQ